MATTWKAELHANLAISSDTSGGQRQSYFDLYARDEPRGLVVYVHGGGWEEGDSDRPPGFRSILADGLSIAAIRYRFSHETDIDGMVRDIRSACRGARTAHRERTGRDVPWFTWGISAGGHLVQLSAATASEAADLPSAVCSWCGPTDLVRLAQMEEVKEHCRGPLSRAMAKLTAGAAHGAANGADMLARWSPVTHIHPSMPPHLFIHGNDDGLVPLLHSTIMRDRLAAAGVPAELFEVDGGQHALPPGDWDGVHRMTDFFHEWAGAER